MNTEKMNIHRALVELKTLESRILKEIRNGTYVVPNKHSNAKIGGISIADFCEDVKSNYQKVRDLIKRREAIKRAVVLSNATTKVVVNGKEYTVAEAIEMKNHGISELQTLMSVMATQYNEATRKADRENSDLLDRRADEFIRSTYGATDLKNMGEEIRQKRNEFIAEQTVELVDPIGVKAQVEELEKYISGFLVEVDSVLSTSNATTEIEVNY